MCGFVGFFDNSNNKEVILDKMMDRIYHRGPDMGGKYYDDDAALGFRRLSILDLSEAGGQPYIAMMEIRSWYSMVKFIILKK